MSIPYPEFGDSVAGMIADAVVDLLKANPNLRNFTNGRIDCSEFEDLYTRGPIQAPSIVVIVNSSVTNRKPGGWADIEVELGILLITEALESIGDQKRLRSRVIEGPGGIFPLLIQNEELRDPSGALLTQAITVLGRIDKPTEIEQGVLLTEAVVTYTTEINEQTREVL